MLCLCYLYAILLECLFGPFADLVTDVISNLSTFPYACISRIAAACWTFHYAKRVFETLFIHRFSHGSMPLRNLFKVSLYGTVLYVSCQIIVDVWCFVSRTVCITGECVSEMT